MYPFSPWYSVVPFNAVLILRSVFTPLGFFAKVATSPLWSH